jgi:hypothetical protein
MKNIRHHFVQVDLPLHKLSKRLRRGLLAFGLCVTSATGVLAGGADVVGATYARSADGTYRFDVTVRHGDAGWEHYADRWQVLDAGGTVLGERVLLHPHDTEQPFTRSQSGIEIPAGTRLVIIRAHDNKHGWVGADLMIYLAD